MENKKSTKRNNFYYILKYINTRKTQAIKLNKACKAKIAIE